MCTIYADFLQEVSETLRERATEAKLAARGSQGNVGETANLDLRRGILIGYYEVLSTLVNQAIAMNIPLEAIGLADFEPDQLLA
jgi:hypothetical protein